MRNPLTWIVAAVLLLAAAAPLAAQPSQGGGELFVQSASEGRLIPVPGKPGVFNLTLAVPGPVVAFTDRPLRRARNESLASFAARWTSRGFGADSPNAALVVDDAPASRDTVVLELLSRRIVSAKVIRYRVRALPGAVAGPSLARVANGADRRVRSSFERASLFVDPSSTESATLNLRFPALGPSSNATLVFDSPVQVGGVIVTTLGGPGTALAALNAYSIFSPAGLSGASAQVDLNDVRGSAITGTAQLPEGVTVTASASVPGNTGALTTITNGDFAVPLPS